jgi:YD repeat-containing protein
MVQVDTRTKATMTHTYDDRGQVALEEVARPGAPVERTRYFRDGEGRPQRSIRQGERGIEEWRYAYDGEGRLQTEEYHLKGALVKVVRYEAEDRRTEELYRRGAVFLRVTYQGDEKVREEVIMEGLVVRVREYGGQDVLHAREATDGDMPAKPPRGFLE